MRANAEGLRCCLQRPDILRIYGRLQFRELRCVPIYRSHHLDAILATTGPK